MVLDWVTQPACSSLVDAQTLSVDRGMGATFPAWIAQCEGNFLSGKFSSGFITDDGFFGLLCFSDFFALMSARPGCDVGLVPMCPRLG